MSFFYLLCVALAVSLDNFCVGFTYGMRQIKLPLKANFIISGASGAVIFIAMVLGSLCSGFIVAERAKIWGSLIIIVTGAVMMLQSYWEKKKPVIGRILDDPLTADTDASGIISNKEALLLGGALALNALGAGFGAALQGLSAWMTACLAAFFSFVLLGLGVKLGGRCSLKILSDKIAWLSGLVLVILALLELLI